MFNCHEVSFAIRAALMPKVVHGLRLKPDAALMAPEIDELGVERPAESEQRA